MTEEQYLTERLEEQIQWYDKKSLWNQRWYKNLKKIELVLSASIPVAVTFVTDNWVVKVLIAVAGATIAIITGIHGLYNLQENWIAYRTTCETLKHERYMYLARSGVYAEVEDPFRVLVERVESIISHENINWAQIQKNYHKGHRRVEVTSSSSSTGS